MHLLDVEFVVAQSEESHSLLRYARSFLDAYESDEPALAPTTQVALELRRGAIERRNWTRAIAVHRSKHPYWSFDGVVHEGAVRHVQWPSRGVEIAVHPEAQRVEIVVDHPVDPARGGEAVFHALRGIALYKRDPGIGNLLHASAIVLGDSTIVFVGNALAGKTTLLTDAVLRQGAGPLANDRVVVTSTGTPEVVSWPSYASYCEGTLLRYDELARSARAYEHESCWYRTQTWDRPLTPRFGLHDKRVYPMTWFAEASGALYATRRPLTAVILTEITPAAATTTIERVQSGDGPVNVLEPFLFDDSEPSFRAWHGLPAPAGALSAADLLARLASFEVPVHRLRTSPAGAHDAVSQLLAETGSRV